MIDRIKQNLRVLSIKEPLTKMLLLSSHKDKTTF